MINPLAVECPLDECKQPMNHPCISFSGKVTAPHSVRWRQAEKRKMTKVDEWYALRYPNGKYVALDPNSGGYPSPVSAGGSHRFFDLNVAHEYASMFRKEDFEVVKLEVHEKVS